MSPNLPSTFWPAPSRYALADVCAFPWSAAAPRWPKRIYDPSDDARFGNAVSLIAQLLGVWGREAIAKLPEVYDHDEVQLRAPGPRQRLKDVAEHLADYFESRPVTWRACELALILNMQTGAAVAVDREVARRPPPHHVGAILDLVEIEDGELVVTDFKSGYQQARTLAVRSDPQLRAYALIAARFLGFRRVKLRIAHASDDAPVRIDPDQIDALELGVIKNEMRARFDRLPGSTTPTPGNHCKRCPIVTSCPAMVAGVEHVTQRMTRLPVVQDHTQIVDADHAGFTRQLGKFLEEVGKRLQAAAKEWVLDPERGKRQAIEIAPGVLYGPVLKNGSESVSLERPGAIDIVQKHLGTGAAWSAAVSFETSKTGLEKGAKVRAAEKKREAADGKRVTQKSVIDPLYEELRAAGHMRPGVPTEVVTEFPKRVEGEES